MTDTQLETEPLISFVIPTYNGWTRVPPLLISIIELVRAHQTFQFEVVICCNDRGRPPDGQLPSAGNCRLSIVHNVTNIGADANFVTALSYARGRYAWLIGDDDVLAGAGGWEVIRLANLGAVALIVTSYEKINASGRRVINHNITLGDNRLDRAGDLLRLCGVNAAFMSILIYRTDVLQSVLASGRCGRYVGTHLIQYYLSLEVLREAEKHRSYGIVLPDIAVIQHEKMAEGFSQINAGYYFGLDGLADFCDRDGLRRRQWITSGFSLRNLAGSIIAEKMHRIHGLRVGVVRALLFRQSIKYWLFIAPLEFLPVIVVRLIVKIRAAIKRRCPDSPH